MLRRPFRARRGVIELRLDDEQATVLLGLVAELRDLIDDPAAAGHDVAARLQPAVFPEDPLAELEYREMTGDDLTRQRQGAADVVENAIRDGAESGAGVRTEIAPDDVEAWLISLNYLRLALGTALGIAEDTQVPSDFEETGGEDDDAISAQAQRHSVYMWLSYLLELLVDESSGLLLSDSSDA